MVIFPSSHRDPGSGGLNKLELPKSFYGKPCERTSTVIQSSGNKGVGKLFLGLAWTLLL